MCLDALKGLVMGLSVPNFKRPNFKSYQAGLLRKVKVLQTRALIYNGNSMPVWSTHITIAEHAPKLCSNH